MSWRVSAVFFCFACVFLWDRKAYIQKKKMLSPQNLGQRQYKKLYILYNYFYLLLLFLSAIFLLFYFIFGLPDLSNTCYIYKDFCFTSVFAEKVKKESEKGCMSSLSDGQDDVKPSQESAKNTSKKGEPVHRDYL